MEYLPLERLRQRLARLSRPQLIERLQAVRRFSAARGLQYLSDDGRPQLIELALIPWILTPQQTAHFHRVSRLMVSALARLPSLYARDPSLRAILPFDPAQQSWMRFAAPPSSRPFALIGRLDSTATFSHASWRADFQMLEPNTVGVGGLHYAPTSCGVLLEVLGDVLAAVFPGRRIVPMPDPRQLLLDELGAVSRRRGRRLRRIALIENTDYTTGTDEFGYLARDCARRGLDAIVADPRELRLAGGRLLARGREVDLLYRDCELGEFIEMEAGGRRLTALREAVRQGRLISGLVWECDQKSAWELFTDSAYARHFTPAQRRLFRTHVPWTRLVREARVSDPSGRRVELVRYIRSHQASLVLKPNTLYGGQGVVIGRAATRAEWERTLAKALRGRTRYVAQRRAPIATHRFPRLRGRGVEWVERSVVSGFFVNSTGTGLIGRFSSDPVVNVSRGGGLLSALMVQ